RGPAAAPRSREGTRDSALPVDGGQKPRIFGEYPVPSGAAPAKTKGGPPAMENDIGIEVG
ncbi:MAG: hypothetical protein ABW166_19735, partial [Sedimenticola sp.]